MAEDDYDLLPHKEIVKLNNEITELRKVLAEKRMEKTVTKQTNVKGEAKFVTKEDISPSIEKLSESINNLLELFKIAGEEIKAEEHHKPHEHLNSINNHLDNLNKRIDILIGHNEEIAKGILVVAEMMKEHLPAINDNTRATYRRTIVQEQIPPIPLPRVSRAQVPPPPIAVQESSGATTLPPPPMFLFGGEDTPQAAPKKRDFRF